MNKFVDRMEKLYGKNENDRGDFFYVDRKQHVGIISKPVIEDNFKKGISLIKTVYQAKSVINTLILTAEDKKIKTLIDSTTFTIITANFPEIKNACFVPNDSSLGLPLPFIGQLDDEYYIVASPIDYNPKVTDDLASEIF